jgi:hypothetical protein
MSSTPWPILDQILHDARAARSEGKLILCAFDLDSTLLDLTPRVSRILDSFVADPQNLRRYPRECEVIARAEIWPADWGIAEAIARAGLVENAANAEFFKHLHRFWADCFFSDDFLSHDEPLTDAVEFVRELHATGAHIMYLSAREVAQMGVGTEKSLRARGFPVDACSTIRLKPDPSRDDAWFKIDVLREVELTYSKIWFFENEPVNLSLCERECPEVQLVFIESTHSRREPSPKHLPTVRDFRFTR